ncbi:MAG: hypothetical protein R6U98_03255, partial [Pirellulaceae bacterium]
SELFSRLPAVLKEDVIDPLLSVNQANIVTPTGDLTGPAVNPILPRACEQLTKILGDAGSSLSLRDECAFAYVELLQKQAKDMLEERHVRQFTEQKREAFVSNDNDSYRCQSHCWFGLKALNEQRWDIAEKHFQQACDSQRNGNLYAPLAELGRAIVACHRASQRDLVDRAAAERNLLQCIGASSHWAEGVRKLIPDTTSENLQDYKWVDHMRVVDTLEKWEQTLARLAEYNVLWVQLQKQSVGERQLGELRDWVKKGGVLWFDTDLARFDGTRTHHDFEFRLKEVSNQGFHGIASPWMTPFTKPILRGLGEQVRFVLSDQRLVASIQGDAHGNPPSGVLPVLGWHSDPRKNMVSACCAIRACGNGLVIYRPRKITPRKMGRLFDENLRSFSFRKPTGTN